MMFINDIDVLNANINNALYRQHGAFNSTTTSTTNPLQPHQSSLDTALHLQSTANSLTFACQQKSSGFISPPIPQTTISYSTSRQDLAPPSSSNMYSSSIYSTSDQAQHTQSQVQNQQAMSNLIPFNITIYNPALSCGYSPAMQNSTIITAPQYPQVATIPNFTNFNTFPQKYIYKTKSEDYSDYQYGVLATTKTTLNKFYSKINSNNSQPYYINTKRAIQQPQQHHHTDNNNSILANKSTESTSNNIYLTNNVHNTAPTIITPLDPQTQPTLIPIRTSIQSLNSSNPRLIGIKKRKKRFKKPIELRKVLPKNSLMLLHELMPNVEYRFVKQNGPIHKPVFTMSVDISQHTFEGMGKTKKEARMMAADQALKFLVEFPEYIQKTKSNKDSTDVTSVDKNDDDNKMDDLTDDDDETNNENDNVHEISETNSNSQSIEDNSVNINQNKSNESDLENIYAEPLLPIL